MRLLILFFLLLLRAVSSSLVQAQCLSLSDLLAIGAEPNALTSPVVVTAHLTFEWTLNGPATTSRDAFWTVAPLKGNTVPEARLMVRAQRPGQDVVLKTTQEACVRQLRSELKNRKLEPQAVTCPGCEAFRFQSPDFDVTVYGKMKGDYPFVVVVHQVPPGVAPPANSAAPAAQSTGAVIAPAVPAVNVAAAKAPTSPKVPAPGNQ